MNKLSTLLIATLLFTNTTFAESGKEHDAHHPAKTESMPMQDEMKMNMHMDMQKMQEVMKKISQAKTPAERDELMKQHMTMMQDGMKKMSGMKCMHGEDHKKHMDEMKDMKGMKDMPMNKEAKSADDKISMPKMEHGKMCDMKDKMKEHMGMMNMMLEQMKMHQDAQMAK